jgi:hypothetical protein
MAPAVAGSGDGIIERLVAADTVRWWNKPNLRRLYLLLVPFCLFIESTSGFDSSMMVILITKFVFECFADLGSTEWHASTRLLERVLRSPQRRSTGLAGCLLQHRCYIKYPICVTRVGSPWTTEEYRFRVDYYDYRCDHARSFAEPYVQNSP